MFFLTMRKTRERWQRNNIQLPGQVLPELALSKYEAIEYAPPLMLLNFTGNKRFLCALLLLSALPVVETLLARPTDPALMTIATEPTPAPLEPPIVATAFIF